MIPWGKPSLREDTRGVPSVCKREDTNDTLGDALCERGHMGGAFCL